MTLFIFTILITIFIYLVLKMTVLSENNNNNEEFTIKKWDKYREERYCLINDIVKNDLLKNLSKNDIIELLGDELNDIHSDIWSYYIGDYRGILRLKRKKLFIFFNTKNKVKQIDVC